MRFWLLIVGIIIFAVWVVVALSDGNDPNRLMIDGVEIEILISPIPSPTSSLLTAVSLEDYCPPEEFKYTGPQRRQAMGAVLFSLLTNEGGRIVGEHFCLFLFNNRYYVVLDFRGEANPIGEVGEWFERHFEYYPRDEVCSKMNSLDTITLRDGGGHPVVLCEDDKPNTPEEQREPEDPLEGDGPFA